jgi:hypothetical protein
VGGKGGSGRKGWEWGAEGSGTGQALYNNKAIAFGAVVYRAMGLYGLHSLFVRWGTGMHCLPAAADMHCTNAVALLLALNPQLTTLCAACCACCAVQAGRCVLC